MRRRSAQQLSAGVLVRKSSVLDRRSRRDLEATSGGPNVHQPHGMAVAVPSPFPKTLRSDQVLAPSGSA